MKIKSSTIVEEITIPKDILLKLEKETEMYKSRLWESWQIKVVKEYYGRLPESKIGEIIGKSKKQVGSKIDALELRMMEVRK